MSLDSFLVRKRTNEEAFASQPPPPPPIQKKQPTTHRFEIADVTLGLARIPTLKDAATKARLIVTSPPYYGARDYTTGTKNKLGTHTTSSTTVQKEDDEDGEADDESDASDAANQLGHEATPYEYVRRLARTFHDGSKFLAADGSLFIVIGDTFARRNYSDPAGVYRSIRKSEALGVFGMLIAEMRAAGWLLWQEIVWSKPSVPPSGTSQVRCTPSSERILWFVLSKPHFDNKTVREEGKTKAGTVMPPVGGKKYADGKEKTMISDGKRCRRDVWEICPSRDKSSHVAPFPSELVEIPILACSEVGDIVLDPFGGTLTVQRVARELNRSSMCFDIIDHTGILNKHKTDE